MNKKIRNSLNKPFLKGRKLVKFFVLSSIVSISACATTNVNNSNKMKPIDQITIGIEDKEMRELWVQANNDGRLPPLEEIPIPDQRVSPRRHLVAQDSPVVKPARPLIHEKVIADIQPFSLKRLAQYKGDFQVIDNKPGVLIGKIRDSDTPLEFHYRLPVKSNVVHLRKNSGLQLLFRDDVQDSALWRRIILSDKGKIAPFVYISEGSNKPYVEVIKEIDLKIEQEKQTGNPPVKVTYKDNVVTLKQGERGKIGSGDNAVEVYLRSSVAINQKEQVLREGQPYYVNLVIYQTD